MMESDRNLKINNKTTMKKLADGPILRRCGKGNGRAAAPVTVPVTILVGGDVVLSSYSTG